MCYTKLSKQTRNLCDLWVTGVTVVNSSGSFCNSDTEIGMLAWTTALLHGRPLLESDSAVAGNLQLFTQSAALESQTFGSSLSGIHFRDTFDDLVQLPDSSKSSQCLTGMITSQDKCSNLSLQPSANPTCRLGLNETPRSSIDNPVPLGNCADVLAQGLFGTCEFSRVLKAFPTMGNSAVALTDLSLCEVRVMGGAGEQKPTTEGWDTVLAWSGGSTFVFGVALTQNTHTNKAFYDTFPGTSL